MPNQLDSNGADLRGAGGNDYLAQNTATQLNMIQQQTKANTVLSQANAMQQASKGLDDAVVGGGKLIAAQGKRIMEVYS